MTGSEGNSEHFHALCCRCLPWSSFRRRTLSTKRGKQAGGERTGGFYHRFLIESTLQTYSVAVALHLFPVLQVHGPDVAIKQAGGVGDRVRPCAAETASSLPDELGKPESCSEILLPPPSFALLVGNGDVETFVVDVDQRPAGGADL